MDKPLKILFKFPCRYRKEMFFESLDSLNDNIRDRDNYLISLTLDTDDEILNDKEVIEKINTYPNVKIEWGVSGSKINAVNRSVSEYDFDVIICWHFFLYLYSRSANNSMFLQRVALLTFILMAIKYIGTPLDTNSLNFSTCFSSMLNFFNDTYKWFYKD